MSAAGGWSAAKRAADQARFLGEACWADADLVPLAGDASSRRYLRATRAAETAVLMDAPPGSQGAYTSMTRWLRTRGFHAPEILAADPEAGFLLLEDLGDDLIARVLEAGPSLAPEAYARITDLLAALHRHPPAPGIPALDGPELARQAGLFAEWYGPAAGAPPGCDRAIATAIETLHARLCEDAPPVTGLRDFHAENIVWRGDAPLGLLDFQDAVAVHPAYDLVSALQDVRRDVAPEIERAALDRYLAATGADRDSFTAAYALLGAQRNLRILGIFARLCLQDGKPRYLAFMPRAWAHLQRDLAHPALAPLAEALAGVPAPTRDLIDRLRARCPTP
nr:phosphotransferase [Paracoccus sp. S-4012]